MIFITEQLAFKDKLLNTFLYVQWATLKRWKEKLLTRMHSYYQNRLKRILFHEWAEWKLLPHCRAFSTWKFCLFNWSTCSLFSPIFWKEHKIPRMWFSWYACRSSLFACYYKSSRLYLMRTQTFIRKWLVLYSIKEALKAKMSLNSITSTYHSYSCVYELWITDWLMWLFQI